MRARGRSGRRSTASSTGRRARPYLYDWVRAQTRPYPGAFTWLGDDEGRDLARAARRSSTSPAPAGTIVERRPEGPVVACGEGGLLLEEFETSGALEVGTVLG